MKRMDITITDAQREWLIKLAEKTGISKSELIRRIFDKEMKKK